MILTLITGNSGKANEYKSFLEESIYIVDLDLVEIQSLFPKEILKHKVNQAYEILKRPVIVDDVSFILDAISPLPGPLIKWFMPNNDPYMLCEICEKYQNFQATAQCMIAHFDGKEINYFKGEVKGTISMSPRGTNGFGFDSVFIPNGETRTWGEIDKATSHRKLAIDKLVSWLES